MTSEVTPTPARPSAEDSIVCYCYRLTTRMLRESYARCGNLAGVEKETRAGTACTGCKVLLYSIFGEKPTDHYQQANPDLQLPSSCKRPGNRLMKGFIISNDGLESSVFASNGVAPQLGDCDLDTDIEYALLDHRGQAVIHRKGVLKTNQTFQFSTKDESLPKPFVGMFVLALSRGNLGSSRFNVQWSNKYSISSTHENASTGRPKVSLPVAVDKRLLNGVNEIFAALANPHEKALKFTLYATDIETEEWMSWDGELGPLASMWLNASEHFYGPALSKKPEGRFILRLETHADMFSAISMYFFIHNRENDVWTANHL